MLIETILVATAAGAIYGYQKLRGRVDNLERRLAALESAASASLAAPSAPPLATFSPMPEVGTPRPSRPRAEPPSTAISPRRRQTEPDPHRVERPAQEPSAWSQATESIVGMVKANPFASLGMLLVLVGVGFLFSLLAARNVLPPALRVVLVGLAGAGTFVFGLRQEKNRPNFAMNLQGGALAAEFLCALWAYQGYGLVSATTAFAWMGGLSTLAVSWAAYKKRGLFAFMGLAGSLLTPIVASTGSGIFSGLTLYCTWITVLGLSVGVYLRTPSLVSATLAGVSALLGVAIGISKGTQEVSLAALLTMLVGYSGVSLHWTRKQFTWVAHQQASIVAVLLGAPLIMVGFMGTMAGLSSKSAALVLGVVALLYLVSLMSAAEDWKGWLLPIGAGLGGIALGVGLEGANRAMAFAATAMSLVVVARAIGKPWAGLAAFAYWTLSALFGLAELKSGTILPLVLSGLVALGAGFVARENLLATVYLLLAPVVLYRAVFHPISVPHYVHLAWFLAWAAGALVVSKKLNWSEIRRSAVWLLPAGVAFLADPTFDGVGIDLFGRELTLGAWLVLSAFLVWAYRNDESLPLFKPSPESLGWASLLLPVLLSYELYQLARHFGATESTISLMLALWWSGWSALALPVSRKLHFDFKALAAGVVAAALVALNVLFVEPSLFAEVAQWASIALLVCAAHALTSPARRKLVLAVYGLAGGALLGTLMRAIGMAYGKHDNTVELLFTRVMQPWVSLLWAAAGIAVVVYASSVQSRKLWMGGGMAIVVLMLKMLLIDLSTFSLAAKVSVFLIMGVAFIALGRYSPLPPEASSDST